MNMAGATTATQAHTDTERLPRLVAVTVVAVLVGLLAACSVAQPTASQVGTGIAPTPTDTPVKSAAAPVAHTGCGGTLATTDPGAPSPACSHPPTAPPGAISEAAAIAAARAAMGDTAKKAEVINTSVQQDYTLPSHEWLWEVRLGGAALHISPCPSDYLDHPPAWSAPPCLDELQGLWVIVDAFSGQVLGTMH